MFGHYIRSHDGSYISSYVKIINVCGIFRDLLNSLFDHLIDRVNMLNVKMYRVNMLK